MINVGYVNGSIDVELDNMFNQYDSFLESCDKDIDSMFAEFELLQEKVTLESAIMGSVPDRMMMVYEDGKKNIFTRIGEMIIKLFEEIGKAIDKVMDKITNLSLSKKTDIQKLEILIKKHPELKDEAVGAFREGVLDLSDIKGMKELDKAFDEIVKMAKNKEDPNSIKTKWEKAKEKFEKDGFLVSAAKKTSAVVGAATAVALFIPNCSKAINELKARKADNDKDLTKAISAIKELEDAGEIDKSKNSLHLLLQAKRFIDGQFSALLKETSNAWSRMVTGITGLLTGSKADDKADKKIKLMNAIDNKKSAKDERVKEQEEKRAMQDRMRNGKR